MKLPFAEETQWRALRLTITGFDAYSEILDYLYHEIDNKLGNLAEENFISNNDKRVERIVGPKTDTTLKELKEMSYNCKFIAECSFY